MRGGAITVMSLMVLPPIKRRHVRVPTPAPQKLSEVLVTQSCLTLCDPWTVARQAPLSRKFSRQEYWNGLPWPPPEDLPNPGIKPMSQVDCIGKWVLYH